MYIFPLPQPLTAVDWNGDGPAYVIEYLAPALGPSPAVTVVVSDPAANSYILTGLQEWTRYDVRLAARNAVGLGPFSPTTSDQTRESGTSYYV